MYLKAEFIFFRSVSLFFLIIILIILSLHSIFIVSKNKLQKEIKYGRFRDPNSIPKEEIDRIQIGLEEVKVDCITISNRFKPLHFIFRNDKDKQIAYELKNELNKLEKKLIGLERNIKRLPTNSCFAGLWKELYKQEKELISLGRKIRKYLTLNFES